MPRTLDPAIKHQIGLGDDALRQFFRDFRDPVEVYWHPTAENVVCWDFEGKTYAASVECVGVAGSCREAPRGK